jgi:hypothetical protein
VASSTRAFLAAQSRRSGLLSHAASNVNALRHLSPAFLVSDLLGTKAASPAHGFEKRGYTLVSVGFRLSLFRLSLDTRDRFR